MHVRNSAVAFVLSAVLPLSGLACAGRSDLDDVLVDAGAEAGPPKDPSDAGPPKPKRSDKLDLLFVVDNSRNLEPAHELLADTLPYLLSRLAQPACVNGFGAVVSETASLDEPCPIGVRDFAPVRDLHIGVISTSIGGHGADICSEKSSAFDPTNNDRARLLTRDPSGGVVETWQSKGFLVWDPGQTQAPPGEADVGALGAKLWQMVSGTGTKGCGFEAQLESIYRFLVDPAPYLDMVVENNVAVPQGQDDVLLQQRADFLRPDSVVAVVLLSDENDCSTRDGGQFFYVNQGNGPDGKLFRMPRGRSVCQTNPADPCCVSCGQATPSGCPSAESDPACASLSTQEEDAINVRCFDQKRRFGIDFLYPTSRYIDGFSEPFVTNRAGEIVANPLFAGGRPKELFFLEGIVGVPWQDLAFNPNSLEAGLKPSSELSWGLVLPNQKDGTPPLDPLMVESIDPRSGTHPLTGDPLAPPTAKSAQENPINGHERLLSQRSDLQYACIYPLRTPKDCTDIPDCECTDEVDTNPVCQAPDGSYSKIQRFARANPGARELAVLKGIGVQGVVASICADEVSENEKDKPTFGYKPAVSALLRAIRWRLTPAE